MKNSIKISTLGGDLRQIAVIDRLASSYDNINVWGVRPNLSSEIERARLCADIDEATDGARVVILPLPSSLDGVTLNCPLYEDGAAPKLTSVARKIPDDCIVIGGRISESFLKAANERGIKVFDYFESEDFQIKNAYTTAEAALSIAMNTLDRNIRGSKIAVTGYGRIAKHLTSLLLALGAEVTVAARRASDLSWAQSYGCRAIRISEAPDCLSELRSGYDVIYNTVPYWLFDRDFLLAVDKGTLIVDLASAPGGVDIRAARELGANVSWATSLPGKYAPRSAGELIAECIHNIIGEGFG